MGILLILLAAFCGIFCAAIVLALIDLLWHAFATIDPPGQEVWRCGICRRRFASRRILERHLQRHLAESRPRQAPVILREAEKIVKERWS